MAPSNGTSSEENLKQKLTTPLLHENLMFARKFVDPMRYYEVVAILGEGSMGSVSKVKKRQEAIGGSARAAYLELQNVNLVKKLQECWGWCCGDKDRDPYHNPHNIFLSGPDSKRSSETGGGSSDDLSDHSSISSMIRFGNQKATYFALKSIHLEQARNQTLREELKNEVEILKTLDNPHIVRPVETFEYKHSLFLVMELCSGGDLYTRDPYTERDAARISQSILSAVAYMHQEGISHRDLKYENIMFTSPDPNADVKIIDFGLSKKYGMSDEAVMHDAVGTIYSMSPEVLLGTYTNQADVWSCGVLTFMLLSSSMPFYGKHRKQVMKRILKGEFAFKAPKWKSVSKDAKTFVLNLLKYEATDRPTARKAARDPWLRTMHHARRSSISQIPETMDQVQASIENFAKYSTLKKLALMVVAHRSTSEEIGFLRRAFRKYDDHKGYVTLEGFKVALGEYMYSDEEIETMFSGIDVDGSGQLHYFEFLAASIEAHGYINEERLAEAFDRLDSDDSGSISVQDLRAFLGSEVSDEYLDKIIEDDDIQRDRMIDYDEFLQMWNIESDSERLKTLESVARRRRFNHDFDKQKSFGGPKANDNNLNNSGISNSGDEAEEDHNGDTTFNHRKRISIRASSMGLDDSSANGTRTRPHVVATADI